MPKKLVPLSEHFKHSSAYWGEKSDWLVCYVTTRDADCLARSNFRCFVQMLGGKKTDGAKGSQEISEFVAIEEASHFACGWIQYLIIHPAAADLIAKAAAALEELDGYPVLNEEDFSEVESEEAAEVWKNCYSEKDRVEYIRENRRQFEFCGFADLLACVRGKYFCGYASELIS